MQTDTWSENFERAILRMKSYEPTNWLLRNGDDGLLLIRTESGLHILSTSTTKLLKSYNNIKHKFKARAIRYAIKGVTQ